LFFYAGFDKIKNADIPAIQEQLRELERSREARIDFAMRCPEELKRQIRRDFIKMV
jgi:hypothetical protein